MSHPWRTVGCMSDDSDDEMVDAVEPFDGRRGTVKRDAGQPQIRTDGCRD